jgi:hypothetical protein
MGDTAVEELAPSEGMMMAREIQNRGFPYSSRPLLEAYCA